MTTESWRKQADHGRAPRQAELRAARSRPLRLAVGALAVLGLAGCLGTPGNTVFLQADCDRATVGAIDDGFDDVLVVELVDGTTSILSTSDTRWVRLVDPATSEEIAFVDMSDSEVGVSNDYVVDVSALCE